MMQDFETLAGANQEVTTGEVDWSQFGDMGSTDKPAEVMVQNAPLGQTYRIIGFIYPKLNYLSPHYDAAKGKKIYDELYAEAISNGHKTYKKVALDETGEAQPTGHEEDLKSTFSLGALMALDLDSYREIKNGVYRVNLQERNAEFFVLLNTRQLKANNGSDLPVLNQTEERVADASSVSSEDKVISIIKPRNLIELAYDTTTVRLPVALYEGADKPITSIGFMVPYATEVQRDGKMRTNFRALFFDNNNDKVSKIGDFIDLPRVANRSYKGDAPSHIEQITNEEQAKKLNPTIDIDNLRLVKKVAKADLPAGTTLQKMEEIPYEDQEEQWKQLGITPAMLSAIRTTGGSSRTYTHAKINELYEQGFAIYSARSSK